MDTYLLFLAIRCVSQSHNGRTVLLACPTQVAPWSSNHNVWQLLPPICTEGLVSYRCYSSFAAALLVACPNFLQREKVQYAYLTFQYFQFLIYCALLLESSKFEYISSEQFCIMRRYIFTIMPWCANLFNLRRCCYKSSIC